MNENMNICKSCGAELEQNANFCPFCGNKVEEEAYKSKAICSKCSREIDAELKFCPFCGNKVGEEAYKPKTICSRCSREIDAELEFCPHCGERIKSNATIKANNFYQLLKAGKILSIIGASLFFAIVAISFIIYGRVYLFGGYEITAFGISVSMILMILGFVLMCVGLITVSKAGMLKLMKNTGKVAVIILLIISMLFSVWGFSDCAANNMHRNDESNGGEGNYSGSGGSYTPTTVDAHIGLSITVNNIQTSSNYTYVYCTIKNVSSKYGNATQYRYVKVKGVFKDWKGNIVDTDWTYAIDSAWLASGESKTFNFMVRNTSIKSATVTIMDD